MLANVTHLELQKRAEVVSAARDAVAANLRALEQAVEALKSERMPDIRKAARKMAREHLALKELIEAHPEMFKKPRTYVVAGIKYGLQKQPGRLTWPCDATLIKRIRTLADEGALSADQVELLINTTERPVAKALEKLDARILKRLGVTVGADTDEPLIKSVDGDVEKAINAIVKEATRDEGAEVSL